MPTVVNKKYHTPTDRDIYIGRPSPLGNPFTHKLGKTLAVYLLDSRDKAVSAYRHWILQEIENGNNDVIKALDAIKEDSILVCWCKPERCHGDIIVEIWRERNAE